MHTVTTLTQWCSAGAMFTWTVRVQKNIWVRWECQQFCRCFVVNKSNGQTDMTWLWPIQMSKSWWHFYTTPDKECTTFFAKSPDSCRDISLDNWKLWPVGCAGCERSDDQQSQQFGPNTSLYINLLKSVLKKDYIIHMHAEPHLWP